MKKPIVIAGNGPSLTDIDYRRLPKNFDTFRVNQFYFEDKYYLGKEVSKYMTFGRVFENQYYTLNQIQNQKEYDIQEICCFCYEHTQQDLLKQLKNTFPDITWVTTQFVHSKEVNKKITIEEHFHNYYLTSSIKALLHAINNGYTDIYLVGIDFYMSSEPYLSPVSERKNFYQLEVLKTEKKLKMERGFAVDYHSRTFDQDVIKLCSEIEGIHIYSISESSGVNELIPLAPIQNNETYIPEVKPENYTNDWVLSLAMENGLRVELEEERKKLEEEERKKLERELLKPKLGLIQSIKFIFHKRKMNSEWEQLRSNIFLRFLKDLLQPLYIILKLIIKK